MVTIESIAGICVCAFKRSIRSGELRRKPFPPQPIFGARSHRRKRNSFGLQVFSLRDYKTIHSITVRCREKRHVRSLIDTFPSIKCLPNTKVKTAVQSQKRTKPHKPRGASFTSSYNLRNIIICP